MHSIRIEIFHVIQKRNKGTRNWPPERRGSAFFCEKDLRASGCRKSFCPSCNAKIAVTAHSSYILPEERLKILQANFLASAGLSQPQVAVTVGKHGSLSDRRKDCTSCLSV